MKKFVFLTLILVLGISGWNYTKILAIAGLQSKSSKSSNSLVETSIQVLTQPVKLTANNRKFKAVGTGRARLSADIYSSVAEEVMAVYFQAQQSVKKGELLVLLDDREQQLALKLAQVQLKEAQTRLKRYNQAFNEGTVPITDYDAALTDLEAAQVAIDQAKLAISDRHIIAPFNGIVGIPNIDPGDRVSTETFITGLDDRHILHIDFEIPESLAGALHQAEQEQKIITATTPAYPGVQFTGHISAKENRIDPLRRTLLARASIDNAKDLLRPGMSFETLWVITGKQFPTVSEIAVQWGRDGSYVWVIRDQKAIKEAVKVIARKSGRVLLEGNLQENEQVVIEGLQRLRPGVSVRLLGNSSI